MIDLHSLIEQANQLAPLPASAVRLAGLIANPEFHMDEVAELVAFDQALTVKILRAANSAAIGGAVPVTTVREAVIRMGAAQVLALAVACGARPLLQSRVPAYGLTEGALWRHSVAAAVAVETAPGVCEVDVPPEAFTAALLHDIGKLIMSRFLSPEILGFIQRAQQVDHLGELEAESLLLNVHHGELGGLIAQHWKLPERVVQGIIYHHNPEQGLDVICDLTCLANQVAKQIEAGLDGRELDFNVDPGVTERLGLNQASLENLRTLASQRFGQIGRRYNAA